MFFLKKYVLLSLTVLSTISYGKGLLLDGTFLGKDSDGKEIQLTFAMLATSAGTATRVADCQGIRAYEWVPKETSIEFCAKDQTKKCAYQRNVVIIKELYQLDQETGTNYQSDFSYVNELGVVSQNSLFSVFSNADATVIYLKGVSSGYTIRLEKTSSP